jgi:(S)-sulfolactate dehydrogenase
MILITEFMDEAAVETLRGTFEVNYQPSLAETQDKIPAMMGDVMALIVRNNTRVTAQILDAAPRLTCVGRLGVGMDNIDLDGCKSHNVTVYPATGANNLSVAEYVITSAMVLLRNAYFSKDKMVNGDWPRSQCAGREISGKMLGLIGFGAIAQHTAQIARAMGMKIAAYDPFLSEEDEAWQQVTRLDLEELLSVGDVLSLHIPLTEQTRHLIDSERLALMKADAILINAARGGVVDEIALGEALSTGKLGGAAIDVFESEPLTANAAERFGALNNVLLTPHIGGVTVESNQRVSALIADKVRDHLLAG